MTISYCLTYFTYILSHKIHMQRPFPSARKSLGTLWDILSPCTLPGYTRPLYIIRSGKILKGASLGPFPAGTSLGALSSRELPWGPSQHGAPFRPFPAGSPLGPFPAGSSHGTPQVTNCPYALSGAENSDRVRHVCGRWGWGIWFPPGGVGE